MSERFLQIAIARVFEVYREADPDPLELDAARRQLIVAEEIARLNRIPPRHQKQGADHHAGSQ